MPNFLAKYFCSIDEHLRELLQGAAVAFVLKVLAAGLAFGLHVVLARLLGAEGSGLFFLAFTIVLMVAALGRVGMENALVRFIAANLTANRPGKVLGVYRKALFFSMGSAFILSVILAIQAPWLSHTVFTKPLLAQPLTIMAIAVIPLALLTLHAHALQGLKKIAESISILSVLVPLITVILCILFVPDYGLNAAALSYLLSTIIILAVARFLWKKNTEQYAGEFTEFDRRVLLSSSLPLFGGVIMTLVITWSPILFLGIWESSSNVGIYSAASRTAMLISFILIAVNSIAAPKFAALYQKGDIGSLEIVAHHSTKLMVIFAAPILIMFVILPEWVMGLFGDEFKNGSWILLILAVGQFFNVVTGSVGHVLMMTGNERLMSLNLLFCSLLAIALNILLIPQYGVIGGAISSVVVLIAQNIIAMFFIWRKLKILTVPWIKIKR